MSRQPYIIAAPDYDHKSAGRRVLHKLCSLLNEAGEKAYLAESKTNPRWKTPTLPRPEIDRLIADGAIVVYPEITVGNPLKGKTVVRYILNNPGRLGGRRRFHKRELLFTFTKQLLLPGLSTDRVLCLPAIDTSIFFDSREQRDLDYLVYFGKHKMVRGYPADKIIGRDQPARQEDLAAMLRRCQKLILYDNFTALGFEATLCGCPVVLIPDGSRKCADLENSEFGLNGIAWGDSPAEFARARQTLSQAQQVLEDLNTKVPATLRHFIDLTQQAAQKYRNILVIRPDAIGDLVLTLPAIQTLKQNFPQARVTVLARPYTAPLLQNHPDIDQVIFDYDLKKYNFDLSVNFFNEAKDTWATFRAGIPCRLGDSSRIPMGWLNNLRVFRRWNDLTRHEVEFNMDLLKPLGIEAKPGKAQIIISHEAGQKIAALLEKENIKPGDLLVGIHLGAATSKTWTLAGFAQLSAWLVNEKKAKVVLLGAKAEAAAAKPLIKLAGVSLINLVSQTSLAELVALISRLKFFVGMDSGAAHIAAALNIPVLMLCLTKRALPGRWAPWQTRHLVLIPEKNCPLSCWPAKCQDTYCAEHLSADQVIKGAATILAGGGNI